MAVINSMTISNIRVTPINPTAVFLFVPSATCLSLPLPLLLSFLIFPSFWSLSSLLHACTHIKWRAAVRFQFRTHLWCCRPPTRSAVAEGTQGSPITALYANALAPGQQRGHAGTASLFMQISGRQSQHRAGHRHQWSYLPASTTVSCKHLRCVGSSKLWVVRCQSERKPYRACVKMKCMSVRCGFQWDLQMQV